MSSREREGPELEKFRVMEEVKRARMLTWTLKSVTGACDTWEDWRPVCALVC